MTEITTTRFGLPVKDADEPLVIPLLQIDIDNAMDIKQEDVNEKANFMTCVLAQAVTRVCGAERVAILRRIAYVAFPGEGVTYRYWISDKSREILHRFDRGEPVVEAVVLKFEPCHKTHRLDYAQQPENRAKQAKRHKRYRQSGKATAAKVRKDKGVKAADALHMVVRNGNLVKWD